MRFGFGVDLGGTTVKMAFFEESGKLLDKWEIPTVTKNEGTQILPNIAASIADYLQKKQMNREQLIGIGIGVPGAVNRNGVVNRCINLGWGIFNVEQALQSLTGLPVKAGNDANVAALGEAWQGGGKGRENLVLATFGTGVGGGIILDGKMVYGNNGAGGEIGHIVLEPKETIPCACGKYGCVEQYCSATGIVRLAKKYLQETDCPSVLRRIEEITCKDIFDAAKAEDAAALAILDQVYDYMGQFLGDVCCVVNPEVVILGGGVSKAGQMLIDGIVSYFRKYVFHPAKDTEFALAELGNDAGAYGAFKLALDAFG